MNTIGSAATPTTAATNNTYSAQALANLSSLASSFTSSTSSASGLNFNNLMLSLLMQIIQTLLKNMQNKNCGCDQPSKPQTLNLTDTEKTKLADALSTDGKAVTIVSVEDSDKSGQLSVGDKVNIQRPTGKLDNQGKPIVESVSVKLTQEQLDRYQNISKPFTLTTEQIANINSNASLENVGFDPKTDQVIDTNKDGKLSAGDTLSIADRPLKPAWTHTLTNDEVNVINGDYGKVLLSEKEQNTATLRYRIGEVLELKPLTTSDYVKTVFDKDNNGELSAGDIALISKGRAHIPEAPIPPYFPEPYIELTADDIKKINAGTITIPDSQKASLDKLYSLTDTAVVDTDGNGVLSKDDVLTGKNIYGYSDRKILTEAMVQQALGDYGSELPINKETSTSISQTLDLKAKSIFGDSLNTITPKQIFDTDNSGGISAGDTMALVTQTYYDVPYADEVAYQQLTNEDIAKLNNAGVVDTSITNPNNTLNLSNQDKQRFVSIFTTASDPANFIKMIDADKSGTISVGDQVSLKEDTGRLDTNNQPILATISETLTANNIKTYENLDAPNQLSAEDTKRAQQSLYPKGSSTGGSSAPKLTGSYYDNDNNNQISLGDQLEALYYKDTVGAPSSDHPYDVTQLLIDEDFFSRYKESLK